MIKELSITKKIFLGLFLSVVFVYCFNAFKEPDSFYHLKAGQVVLETASIPNSDPFSFVANGAEWVAHEWLSEAILFISYKVAGFWGVISFVALLGALTSFIIYLICRIRGVNFYISLLGILILNALTFELWIGRPQIFSYLFTALFVYLLERFRIDGRKINLILIALITLIWANMHAGFILGLAIVFAYLFGGILNHHFKLQSALDKLKLRNLSFLFISLPFIALLNPSSYKIFTYSYVILPAIEKLGVMEWYSILDYLYLNETVIYLAQMVIFGLLGIYWYLSKRENRDFILVSLILGISVLPFISIRHIGFWPVALIPFVLEAVHRFVFVRIENRINSKDFGILLGIVLLLFSTPKFFSFPKEYYNRLSVPIGGAEFIKRENLKGPIFNLYNDGGFLIWNLYPSEKIFIDGRSEVYSQDKLDEYLSILGGGENWRELVYDKYKLQYFFISYRRNPEKLLPLIRDLENDRWRLVYWDDLSVIYVKDDVQNKEIIKKFALNYVGPFRNALNLPEDDKKQAFAELQGLLGRIENSEIIQQYARQLMQGR